MTGTVAQTALNKDLAHIDFDAPFSKKPLYSLIDEAVAQYPNNIAVSGILGNLTYAELAEQVDKAAEGFRQQGIQKGDTVGILLPNSPHFIVSYFGALKAGAKVVALSPMDSAEDCAKKVEDSEAKLVVTIDSDKTLPLVQPLVGNGHFQKLAVVQVFGAELPKTNAFMSWNDLLNNQGILPANVPAIDPENDTAVLQYTGGTTGKSKGAELTHYNLLANVEQASRIFVDEIQPGKDKVMGVLPFFHIFAMTTVMNFALRHGMVVISHPLFDEKTVLEDIQSKKPTLFPAVPTMLDKILNHPEVSKYDLSSIRSSISGGMPLTDATRQAFERLTTGGQVVEGYGLTETSPILCANLGGGREQGGVGYAVPGTEIVYRDLDDPNKPAAPGEPGEICAKGPQVMKGYWKNPEATKGTFTADGFLRTGDIGIADEKSRTHITSRIKEMIIAGGFNIFPSKLENVLKDHPAVKEVAIIGIPHPTLGETPKAFVVLHDNAKNTGIDELAKYMNGQRGHRLTAYEKVGAFEIVDELPKTPIGKIDKKVLTALEEERRAKASAPANDNADAAPTWAAKVEADASAQRGASR